MGSELDLLLGRRYHDGSPPYSGYPEIAQFRTLTPADQAQALERSNQATPGAPLSMWVRAPFLARPRDACAGTGIDHKQMVNVLPAMLREIGLLGARVSKHRRVEQLHLGGGEPTRFGDAQLMMLMHDIESHFGFADPARRDFSIDIDPRRVDAIRLGDLVRMGFNRIHIDVVDFDRDVLAAMHRVQSPALTENLMQAARSKGLRSVAMTLICGLPLQSPDSLSRTMDRVIECRPDRVEACRYGAPRSTEESEDRPQPDEASVSMRTLRLQQIATERLLGAGYVHIGMEQFALPDDELSIALEQGRLQINARGYSARSTLDMLGIGAASLSHIDGTYSRNVESLAEYENVLKAGLLPTRSGVVLSREDELRRYVIERVLCAREVHYGAVRRRFGVDFRDHFRSALARLAVPEQDGLVRRMPDCLRITARGRPFLRSIAHRFDAYAEKRSLDSARAAARTA